MLEQLHSALKGVLDRLFLEPKDLTGFAYGSSETILVKPKELRAFFISD